MILNLLTISIIIQLAHQITPIEAEFLKWKIN